MNKGLKDFLTFLLLLGLSYMYIHVSSLWFHLSVTDATSSYLVGMVCYLQIRKVSKED